MLLKQRKKKSFSIELAPLIDIVFILLIFFAVSSSLISTNKAIDLDLPTASSGQTVEPTLTISVDESLSLFIDQQQIDLNQLPTIISQSLIENNNLQVTLNADKSLPYENIINILDIIRLTGCSQIALQVNKTTVID